MKQLVLLLGLLFFSLPAFADCPLGLGTMGDKCYCAKLKSFVDPKSKTQMDQCGVSMTGEMSFDLRRIALPQICPLNLNSPCPKAIMDYVRTDKLPGLLQAGTNAIWGLRTPDENCNHAVLPASRHEHAEGLEQKLWGSEEFSLGFPPPATIAGRHCMPQPQRGNPNGLTEEQRKQAVAEYYVTMRKLNRAELANQEAKATIYNLFENDCVKKKGGRNCLPSDFQNKKDCSKAVNPHNPDSLLWCEKLNACGPKNQKEWGNVYNRMVKNTEGNLKLIAESLKKLGEIRSQAPKVYERRTGEGPAPFHYEFTDEQKAESDRIVAVIEIAKSQTPWIEGTKFKEAMTAAAKSGRGTWDMSRNQSRHLTNISEALNAQMDYNHQELDKHQVKIDAAQKCFNDPRAADCAEEQKLVNTLPYYQEKKTQPPISDYIAEAQCRQATRGINQTNKEGTLELAITAGLTVATMGVAGAAAEARAAYVLGRSVSGGKNLALLAAFGADALSAVPGVKAAYETCTSGPTASLEGGSSSSSTSQGPQCPAQYDGPNAIDTTQGCAIAILAGALPSLAPFVPFAALSSRVRAAMGKANGAKRFETLYKKSGGDLDGFYNAMARATPDEQGELAYIISRLNTESKVADFKADLDKFVREGAACGVGK